MPVQAARPTGYTDMYFHDPVTGRLLHNPAGLAQPKLLPVAPQQVRKTTR